MVFSGSATSTWSAPLTSAVVVTALKSQCFTCTLWFWPPVLPREVLLTQNSLKNRTYGENFYRHLMCVFMLCTAEHLSSKRLGTIIFHEPVLQPAKFGNKLRLLDITFDKIPPDIALFEPREHSILNLFSVIGFI